ncbi:cation-translocating P-type ATPase [Aquabacterium sp.]|uniref:cation-translocating P-type ATPase n=1 Tax=Aquabacterium sp. TaxID=1872578 RepID=UPI0037849C28
MTMADGDTSAGLSDAEALARLQRDGPNRLPPPEHHSLAALLLRATLQPMALLLLACTLLYALLGDGLDAVVLGASIIGVVAISALQELRAQRVIEALRDLASPRSTVWRSGRLLRIASQDLVQGDRLVVQEGDRLACDATLLRAHGLRLDESLLTGESVPVDKQAAADGADDAGAQLHAGTLVVQGDGVARVTATGARTALGRIGGSLASVAPRPSRLHQDLQRLVRTIALLALAVCLLASTLFAWRSGSWTSGLLVGLTLAMSIVPEEFAVVWSVMLALGAWRLARGEQVLTRQPQAIEALGATTVLCVDKTGTLTRNRMAVVALHDGLQGVDGGALDAPPAAPVPAALAPLLQAARLASVAEGLEPMDQALLRLRLAGEGEGDREGARPALALLRREGVVPGRPFVRQCWRAPDGSTQIVALKGAPEALLPRCADAPARLQALQQRARDWAARGWRVLAVAEARCPLEMDAPDAGYLALGLLAFEDPLREDVPAALQACHAAGLRVVMITGDAPATALAIATQAGLATGGGVLAGAELDALNEAALELAVRRVSVYARVTPAQKLRLVQALQRRGEVVAMTGDGVNDGPALRAADVGVAMGQRGTDVAREAASLVLLDDRFGALVAAVRAGRRIFANLQKSLAYLVAAHVPIVGLALMPLLPWLGGPVLLLPLHVVLFELIVDPACSLVFEAEALGANGMHVPPRPATAPLFSAAAAARALGVGALGLLGTAAVQALGHALGWSDAGLRGAGLASLVLGNLLMLAWFRRGAGPAAENAVFVGLVAAIGALALPLMAVPALRDALAIAPAPTGWLLLPAAALAWAAGAAWRLRRARARKPKW